LCDKEASGNKQRLYEFVITTGQTGCHAALILRYRQVKNNLSSEAIFKLCTI